MPRYIITVTEIGQETRTVGRQWQRGAAEDGEGYGYTPEVETICDYDRDVFRQELADLDLAKLVTTINE